MNTEDQSLGDLLLDLFGNGDYSSRLRASHLVLDIIPEEERLSGIRQRLVKLFSSGLTEPELGKKLKALRREMFGLLEQPGQMTYPFRLTHLLLSFWLPDSEAHLYHCSEWIDEFFDLQKVDTSEVVRKLLRTQPN